MKFTRKGCKTRECVRPEAPVHKAEVFPCMTSDATFSPAAPAPSSGEDGLPAEVGGATMEGGVATSEGDLLQMSEFQLPAGEEVPMGSGEEGAGVLPDDVIQETPPKGVAI